MMMQGFEVKFNVYAESQAEADAVSAAIKEIINENARQGIAVTATKITEAIRKWGNNPFLRGYFKR